MRTRARSATHAASTPPGMPCGGIADRRDRRHHRAGSDLADRDRIKELAVRHPVVSVNRVALHQGDDHEPSSKGQRPHLEGRPRERAEASCWRHARQQRAERSSAERAALDDELDDAAAQQREHEIRADPRGCGCPDRYIHKPACRPAAIAADAGEARAAPGRGRPGRLRRRPPRRRRRRRRGPTAADCSRGRARRGAARARPRAR